LVEQCAGFVDFVFVLVASTQSVQNFRFLDLEECTEIVGFVAFWRDAKTLETFQHSINVVECATEQNRAKPIPFHARVAHAERGVQYRIVEITIEKVEIDAFGVFVLADAIKLIRVVKGLFTLGCLLSPRIDAFCGSSHLHIDG
jgi:hypothetical protein